MLPPTNKIQFAGALIIASLSATASAQNDVNIHESTLQPADGRFEIVQSPLAAKWTFRLDRHSGQVDQLVKTYRGGNSWQGMPMIGLPRTTGINKPRFVLFTSGLAARHTFLIDTTTGEAWAPLTTFPGEDDDSDAVTGWVPFEE